MLHLILSHGSIVPSIPARGHAVGSFAILRSFYTVGRMSLCLFVR
jgi:hypothetical protein